MGTESTYDSNGERRNGSAKKKTQVLALYFNEMDDELYLEGKGGKGAVDMRTKRPLFNHDDDDNHDKTTARQHSRERG